CEQYATRIFSFFLVIDLHDTERICMSHAALRRHVAAAARFLTQTSPRAQVERVLLFGDCRTSPIDRPLQLAVVIDQASFDRVRDQRRLSADYVAIGGVLAVQQAL